MNPTRHRWDAVARIHGERAADAHARHRFQIGGHAVPFVTSFHPEQPVNFHGLAECWWMSRQNRRPGLSGAGRADRIR